MPKTLSKLGEFGLIDIIRRQTKPGKTVLKGIGDDTAVLNASKGRKLLFTTDMLVEGVHFTMSIGGDAVGHKALACSISDIAAMGGVPKWAVVSFGAPANFSSKYAKDIYSGIKKIARKFNVEIVGGDTVKSRNVVINVALIGEVKNKEIVMRSGAKKGDLIFVTGKLGGSLKNGKHCSFTPRIKESQSLVRKCKPHAMIDISDGLVADLSHVLEESKVGAVLYKEKIPVSCCAKLNQALYDGEDFELLFTLPKNKVKQLQLLEKRSKFCFCWIGEITKGVGQIMMVDEDSRNCKISKKGYDHFRE